jgi:hypothetical protein
MNLLNRLTFSNRIKTARIFFIISAFYGLFLRFHKVFDGISVNYKYVLESHSHVAFLGWGFLAVITLVDYALLKNAVNSSKFLKVLYLLMSISIFGMLLSFPLQGYHFFSIFLLSTFLISSYLYLFKIFQLLDSKYSYSNKFIKSGIYFYFLSSIAVWSIGIIAVKTGKNILYHNTIYFYLHFLYNGFFVFTLFGLFYKYIEVNKLAIKTVNLKRFYQFTLVACVPAYLLSILWSVVPNYIYFIAFIAGFLQLISLFYLFPIVKKVTFTTKFYKNIFLIVIASYYLKVIFQFLSVFPFIMQTALQLKPFFIIGYLHLFTLGFMSLFIILLIMSLTKIRLSKIGVNTLALGILLSEFFLFVQGVFILINKPIYYINELLFFVSIMMPLGILMIHFNKKV